MKVKTLLAVIEAGSYTKAAQELNLIQPVVSHQIRLLENEFDIKIFYRNKNKLKLTSQGKILMQYARRVATVYSNTCQTITSSEAKTSHLNVDITPMTGKTIIPQMLTTLCNENPDIRINVCANTIQKIYSRLKAHELGFTVMKGGVSDTALVSTTLNTDYPYLVVSPVRRPSRAKIVFVEGVHYEKLILRSHSIGTGQLFEEHLGVRDMNLAEFNVMIELDNVSVIKELVTMDLGITTIAKSVCREELASGRLVIIPIENLSIVRRIDMVYQKDFPHPGLIRNTRGIYEQLKAK